jgi:hypothetical protein
LSCAGQHEHRPEQSDDHREERQIAERDAGGDHQRDQRERHHQRRTEVGLDRDQHARRPGGDRDRCDRLAEAPEPLRMVRQEAGHVQDDRQLHQLRGLELDRAGREPPSRAIDLDAEARHEDQ